MRSIPFNRIPIGEVTLKAANWNPARDAPDTEIKYVDLSAVDNEKKSINDCQSFLGRDAPSRARQLLRAGDILVSTVRPNLNGVARVPAELDGATASTGFCVLRPNAALIDTSFLFHWVQSTFFVDDMVGKATGASYPAVSDKIVLGSEISLPPLDEQKRIAAILDQADELRRKRQQALTRLNQLGQAIFIEMFGDPVDNPMQLPRQQLGALIERIDSGWSPVCSDRMAGDSDWGVLKLGAVTWDEFNPLENKALPDDTLPRPELEVLPGDVLFSRKNTASLVAACVYVFDTPPRLMLSDLIFRFVFRDPSMLNPVYLTFLLSNSNKRACIQRLAGGSAGSMPNISKSKLLSELIEVPAIEQQNRFAEIILGLRKIQSFAGVLDTASQSLFTSLQHRAFTGQLTATALKEAAA